MASNSIRMTKGERTAQRIMDVAEKLFATRGYSATTLRNIADEAGLSEPGLYNYFNNKNDLYRAVLERVLNPMAGVIDEQLSKTGESDNLRQLPTLIMDLLATHPHIAALFQRALISPQDNIGHGLMLNWIEKLMKKSLPGLHPTENGEPGVTEDAVLMIIAMFNLSAGYFTAAPMLQRLTDGHALAPELLSKQKRLMERASGPLLKHLREPE